ncbi:universal stress protein [Alteraurantiacibacter palmitatis]|uniref:Universal stress protein n=1 Tax=Alteraurantiacibacter palmitatis TaxID=2054628 RepID=A0ABV7E4B6_9SPHN
MSEPILVATDFGARNDRAVDRALQLGHQLGRPVVLGHVIAGQAKEVEGQALHAMVRGCLPDPDAAVDFAFCHGSKVGVALAALAQDRRAAMIVMGVARFHSIGDYVLGTAVDHVLRNGDAPVLVVKQRPHSPYRKIGVASDFSDISRDALLRAAALFPEAELHLIHAYRVPFAGWQKAEQVKDQVYEAEAKVLDAFLANLPMPVTARLTTHMAYGALPKAIGQVIAEKGIDLLVLGSHGESGFRHATLGSQAIELLRTSAIDTMVIRPAQK